MLILISTDVQYFENAVILSGVVDLLATGGTHPSPSREKPELGDQTYYQIPGAFGGKN